MTTTPAGAAPASLDAVFTRLVEFFGVTDLSDLAGLGAAWAAARTPTPVLTDDQKAGLAVLREPFQAESIARLPKINCGACSKAMGKCCPNHDKARCAECGQWMTTGHIHLDYVGHAETTDRLLKADPAWNWEPLAWTPDGLPRVDGLGGMWIRLTVCGVTRLGYGDAQGKSGANAVKETIGDAIRNAAMRFGVALDLWAKTDLHPEPQHPGEILIDRMRESWKNLDALLEIQGEAELMGQVGYLVPNSGGEVIGSMLKRRIAQLMDQQRPAPEQPQATPPAEAPAATQDDLDRREAGAMAAADSDKPEVQAQAARELAGIDHEREQAQAAPSATEQAVTAGANAEEAFRTRARDAWKAGDADAMEKVLVDAQTKGLSGIPSDPANPDGPKLGAMLRAQIAKIRAEQKAARPRQNGAA